MKHFVALSALVCGLFLFRCASSPSAATNAAVDVKVEQLPDAGFTVENRGAASIAYQLTVRNHTSGPITLRKIEMQAVGRSPYVLRKEAAALTETVAAGEEALVPFSMWSSPRGSHAAGKQMVWVTGTLFFESGGETRTRNFEESFREP